MSITTAFWTCCSHEGENRSYELIVDLLQPYIDRGELGIKTGKGFYSYPDPAYGKSGIS